MGRKYYAVRQGRQPGLYTTWTECKKQVTGFPDAEYRSFLLKSEAQSYLSEAADSQVPQTPVEDIKQEFASESNGETTKPKSPSRKRIGNVQRSAQKNNSEELFYQLEYDGASKGNPGRAGAGALLRDPSGSVVQELTIGLGTATNNSAEYQGLILGLQAALDRNITRIRVQGDSKLVCKQVAGEWAVKNESLRPLHAKAHSLSKQFMEFSICHVDRGYNSAADALANKAINDSSEETLRELAESTVESHEIAEATPLEKLFKQQAIKLARKLKASKSEFKETIIPIVPGDEPLYLLEFDGASKGNPGKAGAGALLRNSDGSILQKLSLGLEWASCNSAEYEGLILGLRAALDQKITRIQVIGDSQLVCKQVLGEWAVKHSDLKPLYERVKELIGQFSQFNIQYVDRDLNADADALANKGVTLQATKMVVKPTRRKSRVSNSEEPKKEEPSESTLHPVSDMEIRSPRLETSVTASAESLENKRRRKQTKAKKEIEDETPPVKSRKKSPGKVKVDNLAAIKHPKARTNQSPDGEIKPPEVKPKRRRGRKADPESNQIVTQDEGTQDAVRITGTEFLEEPTAIEALVSRHVNENLGSSRSIVAASVAHGLQQSRKSSSSRNITQWGNLSSIGTRNEVLAKLSCRSYHRLHYPGLKSHGCLSNNLTSVFRAPARHMSLARNISTMVVALLCK